MRGGGARGRISQPDSRKVPYVMNSRSKKIYLIYTSNSKMYPYFPSSSLSLAGILVKSGYQPVIIDTELEPWEKTDFSDALCVCISTFTGPWLKTAINVAQTIRHRHPQLKILWGGPHAIALPELTARHPLVDALCYTEGENVIAPLVDGIYSGLGYENVRGIMFRSPDGSIVKNPPPDELKMDDVEVPPYELLNLNLYSIKQGRIYYQTSRGCVFKCRFCSYESGKKWRGKSYEKVIADFIKIDSMFHPEELQLFDGNFFVDLNRVRQILQKKIDMGLKFRWSAYCRFDTFSRLDTGFLELMQKSGCYELKFGGESGSRKILEYVQKETKPEQISDGVEKCVRYGITPMLSFMTGFPNETDEDLACTVRLIKDIKRNHPRAEINGLFLLQHLPNTPLTDEIISKYGIKHPDTLEKWINYHLIWTIREDYPWMSRREYSARKTLSSIISYQYLSDILLRMPKSLRAGTLLRSPLAFFIFRASDYLIRKVFVALRWEKNFMFLPLEWRLWDLFRKKLLRMC